MSQSHEPDPHRPPTPYEVPSTTPINMPPGIYRVIDGQIVRICSVPPPELQEVEAALDRLYGAASVCDPLDGSRGPYHDRATIRERLHVQLAEVERLRQAAAERLAEFFPSPEDYAVQERRDTILARQVRIEALKWAIENSHGDAIERELDRLSAEAKA